MLTNTQRPAGALEARYPNSSLKFKLFYGVVDSLLGIFHTGARDSIVAFRPRSILLVNIGHLGDVLIATSVLPVLRRAFPDAKIGFLVGSWSLAVVRAHPQIDWIHCVDHYRLNRSTGSVLSKLWRYAKTWHAALQEIRRRRYDVAINLFSKPNVIGLLWQVRIPVRIGYNSGGLGPLLTHSHRWVPSTRPMAAYHLDLLTSLGIESPDKPRYELRNPGKEATVLTSSMLQSASLEPNGYVVVHMGTGEPQREWPRDKWRGLAAKLREGAYPVVLTGSGEQETLNAAWITANTQGCIDFCGKMDWDAFVSIVSKARLVFCVESVASHVAAAVNVPCVAVWSGITAPALFRPLGKRSVAITAPVPCVPCYRGCAGMECVRDVEVTEVYERGILLMRSNEGSSSELS